MYRRWDYSRRSSHKRHSGRTNSRRLRTARGTCLRDQLPSTGEPSFCPFWALGLLALFLILLGATNVTAQTYGAETPGEFRTASQLTGDWWGVRPRLESEGVTFLGSNTSFLIGNATGGASQALDYSGHGDYLLKFDGSKLGIADDTYLKLRAEHP